MLLKCTILLALAQIPLSDANLPKQFKDAQEFVMNVTEKMPEWDADVLGQYERQQIAIVKDDCVAASQEQDPDDFMIDVEQLREDWNLLLAMDERLHHERVI